MLERRNGVVVNVLDIGGAVVPWRSYSAYCMTKAAMNMLTQVLALELAPHVRVNGVAPGTVLPPESLEPGERERLRSSIPLERFGRAEDVAETVRFLVSGPDFITGEVIVVDGGRVRGNRR
jgi:pteridine reductase